MAVKLPLGKDIFPKVREEGCYYIDKTEVINKILDTSFDVLLITRPRRFGKSLTLSMLEDFFDIGRDSRAGFEGLKISAEKDLCMEWQNQWPTISVTLKDIEGLTFEDAYGQLKVIVSELCGKYAFLGDSGRINKNDKTLFCKLAAQEADPQNTNRYIALLTRMMHTHYGKPAIVLIDEYDVPLAKADENGYYKEMLSVIRAVFAPLKSNPHMKFAIVTGCLKIAKESIFTGTNNFVEDSILGGCLEEYIGFTEPDVEKILGDSGFTGHAQEVRDWYDGYLFGSAHLYCPWDVLNHVFALQNNPGAEPEPYWLNTSGNAIVRRLLKRAGENRTVRDEIDILMDGGSISKRINSQITYSEAGKSADNLWSVLYLTGYLTKKGTARGKALELVIPNREIHDIFVTHITEWMTRSVSGKKKARLDALCDALMQGDADKVRESFEAILKDGISVRDSSTKDKKENFYHGILYGLLETVDDWSIRSNAEAGDGYADICVRAADEDTAFLIEAKYADKDRLEAGCREAMGQIRDRGYLNGLKDEGFSIIHAYGIACFKKHCMVMCETVKTK